MVLAYLPDFELTAATEAQSASPAALMLRPRTGMIVAGELFEPTSGLDPTVHADRLSCTVILPDGSCIAATTRVVRESSRSQWRAGNGPARRGTSRVFQAMGMAAQPSAVQGIFVYGTLMRGEELGHLLAAHGSADAQPASVPGQLRHLGNYPGLVLSDEGGVVHGELVATADPGGVLAELDEIECARPRGEPGGLYRRTLVTATLENRQSQRAWVYVIDDPGGHPIIRSGNWRDRF